jgi:hypothetical protein
MAYRGIANPQIRVMSQDGNDVITTIDLPLIVRDGRNEEWENLTESYENIDGEIITGAPKFRFKAEYQFAMVHGYDNATQSQTDRTEVDGGFIDKMSQFYNNRTQFNLIPHSDTKFINYDVIIEELDLQPFEGLAKYASAKVTFLGVKYSKAIPTIDNMLGCVFYNRIFGIDDVN